MDQGVKAVRQIMPAASRQRSTPLGLLYFAIAVGMYASLLIATACIPNTAVALAGGLATGVAIAVLFVVGHDACHGSLTPNRHLNAVIGRLAFLPSLHPYAAWEYSHNGLHHGWTNLRGKDPGYCPRTVDEFRALPRWQQRLERCYRTWLGLLPLYLFTIWWTFEIAPSPEHRRHLDKRGTFPSDRALVAAYLLAQVAAITTVDTLIIPRHGRLTLDMLLLIVIPFLAFTWLIGFATLQHHTHPRVRWYQDVNEWNFFRSQVQGTVHIEFPRWIEVTLNNIMEHTAHHVDPRVPLYHLTDAQDCLEVALGAGNVITEPFSLAGMSRTLRDCQLYNYETHQWLTFDGVATTEAIMPNPSTSVLQATAVAAKASTQNCQ